MGTISRTLHLRHFALVAGSAVLILTLTAYAVRPGSDAGEQGSKDGKVSVVLTELAIELPDTLQAGETTFEIRNKGKLEHSFEIENDELEKALESRLAAGKSATLTVSLEPGEYRVYCPVADHAERGMSAQLVVTGPTR